MKTNQLIKLKRLQIKHIGNLILDLQKEMNETIRLINRYSNSLNKVTLELEELEKSTKNNLNEKQTPE